MQDQALAKADEEGDLIMDAESPERILSNLLPSLIRIAYRTLGSVTEAEDIVQETAIRWLAADVSRIRAQ